MAWVSSICGISHSCPWEASVLFNQWSSDEQLNKYDTNRGHNVILQNIAIIAMILLVVIVTVKVISDSISYNDHINDNGDNSSGESIFYQGQITDI